MNKAFKKYGKAKYRDTALHARRRCNLIYEAISEEIDAYYEKHKRAQGEWVSNGNLSVFTLLNPNYDYNCYGLAG